MQNKNTQTIKCIDTYKNSSHHIEKTLGFPLEILSYFPKYFLIETINYCNSDCIMCGIDFKNKSKSVISDRLFNKINKELSCFINHVEKVGLYLDCEPLLDENIHLRIKSLKDGGVRRVYLATNASFLNDSMAIGIINAGLDEIYIGIDSLKKDTYEIIRRGLSFETVYANTINFIKIRNKLNSKIAIRIQMILQEPNYNETSSFVEHWVELLRPYDQIVIQKAHNWASRVEIMSFGDEQTINDLPCISLWGTVCIHVNGDVGLCCMDTNNKVHLGNINTQSIYEIWHNQILENIRNMHLSNRRAEIELCNGCTVWRKSKHYIKRVI